MTNSPHKKLRVAVLYGGRSGEHEVSLRSAASVIRHLDRERFDILPVAIDKKGRWLANDLSLIEKAGASLPVLDNAPTVVLPPNPGSGLMQLRGGGESHRGVDVVFPVMHGPLCEDGTIQGLLELADMPYVGCGVLASAVGMDKDVAKRLARDAGIPIVPYLCVKKTEWERNPGAWTQPTAKELGFPVFVKPANLGSSVGVHRVTGAAGLEPALRDAFRYDTKVLIEKGINAREVELAVLENPEAGKPALVSVPGEVIPTHEFYSYEAKYLDENGAALLIPARLTPDEVARAQEIAGKVFATLDCEGMTRCDLFIDKVTGEFYFNEVNTIPGFTSISMYPKMWEASGIPYTELLSRLIDLAVARHARKTALVREFHQD